MHNTEIVKENTIHKINLNNCLNTTPIERKR